jgi:hypothetical protein
MESAQDSGPITYPLTMIREPNANGAAGLASGVGLPQDDALKLTGEGASFLQQAFHVPDRPFQVSIQFIDRPCYKGGIVEVLGKPIVHKIQLTQRCAPFQDQGRAKFMAPIDGSEQAAESAVLLSHPKWNTFPLRLLI